ncbi:MULTISPECIES: VOC family protein [Shouchella]|jgi:uncharacterized glyoxalase superfamily protein PhnB|uniref:Glyoxalase n=1 Tax=Shouchella clausii TaxID=79880 RepID=A0A268S5F0_SHOCL|nr:MULTISPECIES: VOC family protein [Shouchella]PAD43511.1 glyoxalase [Bacillus sp. 7520-S]SPU19067.1 glyoxalase family protein [Niallia circulans]MBU8595485.1 VOC family protein [Shouchella clausii]MCY1103532.1 VOC family protein [Shouchella clausii]MEB5480230.1 VOC family protein [Shouchella clausii]
MTIKLDMVGIVVANMREALDFYRVLGFQIADTHNDDMHVEIDQEGVRLAFDKLEMAKEIYGNWEEPTGHRVELAFRCESREALDQLYEKIVDKGYVGYKEPWDAFWGQRYAIVQDPDGNLISLFV